MREENDGIKECPDSEVELGKNSSADGSVGKEGMDWKGRVGLTRRRLRGTVACLG